MMEAARSPGAGMPGWAVSPPTSGIQCGIGCNINVNERGELVIKKVIPGGPAAFSCELGLDDVLVRVDGVSVEGDSTEEVAKRIVGPAGFPLSIVVRHLVPVTQPPPDGAVRTRVQLRTVESNVTLIRQPTVHIPERISEGNVGLGVEMLAMPNGERRVVKMQQGGTAQLSGKINIGDHVLKIDGKDVGTLRTQEELSALLTGAPFSRISLLVRRGLHEAPREVHVVRSVLLLGEFMMKYDAYHNSLKHAILQPQPPSATGLSQHHLSPASAQATRRPSDASPSASFQGRVVRVEVAGGSTALQPTGKGGYAGATGEGGGGGGGFERKDVGAMDLKLEQVFDSSDSMLGMRQVGGGASPHQSPAHPSPIPIPGNSPFGGVTSLDPSATESYSSSLRSAGSWGGTSEGTIDGMASRSSTASRDSIAGIVQERFAGNIDSIRTVEGREATFADGWPHGGNARLSGSKMALAGFVYYPDSEAIDKVMCAYCGLELGQWEEYDDPSLAHHDASPGCSFWRKSSSAGDRTSRKIFSGYGSPYHSLFQSADVEQALSALRNPVLRAERAVI